MKQSPSFSRWRPHPWHGLEVGPDLPRVVNAYIEISPFDQMKYEIDKDTGYLCIDRPQRTSAQQPTLYGFIPRTYCGNRVRDLMPGTECGDGDPLDICVISERPIDRTEILIKAKVVGGLPMNDGGEADDKIIAIVQDDPAYGHMNDISELPPILVERIAHYFNTYKMVPGKSNKVSIGAAYGFDHATTVLQAAMADYDEDYGHLLED
ncbi:inorganic pyrophosphatase [Pseudohongiella sp.]|uniref:inorganic diphosphatase n=1 Tax=marine sediment metagenome TaxID=412755 RepID=A0A0F9W373_9ZZZZ|nr:inorganic pyrophosphatase [Pseudohongiella sp.]HDZ08422.1 inorganic pyrophosphatase [Pseudohongiella sp.]HEA62787.1 inorganic pyrophosphatase [Pseudohongiella sp.]